VDRARRGLGAQRVEHLERVGRPRQLEVEDLLAGLRAQAVDEGAGLAVGNEVVAGSLHHEERHEARPNEGHGRPVPEARRVLGRARAEHPRRGALDHPAREPTAVVEDRE